MDDPPRPVTFQVKLFEGSNTIEVHYLDAVSDHEDHAAGIENPDGTIGKQFYFGEEPLPLQSAVRYTPDLPVTDIELVINTSNGGTTKFNGAVGGTTPLASITTNADGKTQIGANLTTNGGSMTFHDAVELLAGSTLTDTGGTGVTFKNTVNGAFDLTLAVTGPTTFEGSVGATTPIGDGTGAALTINSTGSTVFQSMVATASGIVQADTAGGVTFQQDVTIAAGNTASAFNGSVVLDGLTLTSAGNVRFGNAASDTLTLSSGPVTLIPSGAGG